MVTSTIKHPQGRLTADTNRNAVINAWHVADASVARYTPRRGYLYREVDYTDTEVESGTWYVLSVKRHGGKRCDVIARRRTLAELLELVEARRAA